ncbi:MAG: DNA methyltransferase, partial [Oscillospiraceae bacterium]
EYTNTWAFSKESLARMIVEKRNLWKESLPKQKEFLYEMTNENKAIKSSWGVFDAQSTTVFLKHLIPEVKFENPKPLDLMKYLIGVSAGTNDIVIDFFSG